MSDTTSDSASAAKPRLCPICRKPRKEEFTPFCSRGCKDRDLNQWFNDGYAVPGRPAAAEEIALEDWGKED